MIHRNVARALLGIAVLLLLGFAWTGLGGALDQFPRTATTGQRVQSVAQLAFGVLGIASLVAWFWARRWSRLALVGWALSVALAGGLAPVVWGESSVGVGFLSGVASLLIAWGIIWLLRFSTRSGA